MSLLKSSIEPYRTGFYKCHAPLKELRTGSSPTVREGVRYRMASGATLSKLNLRDDPIATAPGSDTWLADTAFCKYSDQKNNYSAREASGRDCDCNHVRIVNPLSPASESVGKLVSVVLCVTSVPLW